MSHRDQNDGIRYANHNEEYHVSGLVTIDVPFDFHTRADPSSAEFEVELLDNIDLRCVWDMDINIDEMEIVKREE